MAGVIWGCVVGRTLGVCTQEDGSSLTACGNAIIGNADSESKLNELLGKFRLVNEVEFMRAVMVLKGGKKL